MTEATLTRPGLDSNFPRRALKGAAQFWFVVAAIGHGIFVAYILGAFGPPILSHGMEGLKDAHLPNGYVAGEPATNLAAIVHVLLAAVIIGGGPLQLIPQIRARFPAFHHWLGRIYVASVVLGSLAGLFIVWVRGSVGDIVNDIAVSGNAVVILICAFFALKHAIARNLPTHRRWAMRLFLVGSGVWFFRIGLMAWVMATGGAGVDFETFTGPFIMFWGFGQYLVPLTVLELYFRVQDSGRGQLAMAGALGVLAVVTGFGIFAATMGLWLPRM